MLWQTLKSWVWKTQVTDLTLDSFSRNGGGAACSLEIPSSVNSECLYCTWPGLTNSLSWDQTRLLSVDCQYNSRGEAWCGYQVHAFLGDENEYLWIWGEWMIGMVQTYTQGKWTDVLRKGNKQQTGKLHINFHSLYYWWGHAAFDIVWSFFFFVKWLSFVHFSIGWFVALSLICSHSLHILDRMLCCSF